MMKSSSMNCIIAFCAVLVLGAFGGPVMAGDEVVNLSGTDPTAKEIVNVLKPRKPVKPPNSAEQDGPNSKGLELGTLTTSSSAVGTTLAHPGFDDRTAVSDVRKASFDQINFDLDSDRLTPKARQLLDRVSQALTDPQLAASSIVVEGHTDATGRLQHNMVLSQARAEAVKRYLVEHGGIDAKRLQTIGRGPTDLMDKEHPASGVNRRVVFS